MKASMKQTIEMKLHKVIEIIPKVFISYFLYLQVSSIFVRISSFTSFLSYDLFKSELKRMIEKRKEIEETNG